MSLDMLRFETLRRAASLDWNPLAVLLILIRMRYPAPIVSGLSTAVSLDLTSALCRTAVANFCVFWHGCHVRCLLVFYNKSPDDCQVRNGFPKESASCLLKVS
jgi:hypothetical protein